jgi:atypical dual specificity phosphatase
MMTTDRIEDSLWWVMPGRLGGLRKPMAGEVPQLATLGIDAIVSVMDDPSNLDLYEQAGMPHLWLPTTGGKAPTLGQIEQFTAFVDDRHANAQGVGVHCTSGRRRTGTFLAAYLIQRGATPEAAIATVLQANPLVELRDTQIAFLRALSHHQ